MTIITQRRKNGITSTRRVILAAIAGIILVTTCAILFYFGSGSPAGAVVAPPVAGKSPEPTGVLSYNVPLTSGYEPDAVMVPGTGVFIKVIYRGSYEGNYTTGTVTEDLENSGERVIAVENPGNTISATVKKKDTSSRQVLTVEIWKDGARRAANSTSVPFGKVLISAGL